MKTEILTWFFAVEYRTAVAVYVAISNGKTEGKNE